MATQYVVQQGDCISSIAADYGFLPDTIWNHPANAELRSERQNGNILYAGDVLTIPDVSLRKETRPTDKRHVFRRKGVPEKLKIVLLDDRDLPRQGLKYILTIDGQSRQGTTQSDGSIEEPIPPGAKSGHLIVFEESQIEQIPLDLGCLDPLTEISGVQKRLSNLGYDCPSEGEMDDDTAAAIAAFQQEHSLDITGKIDDATRDRLKQAYGS